MIENVLKKAPLDALVKVSEPSRKRPDMTLTPEKIQKVVKMLGEVVLYGGSPGISMMVGVSRQDVVAIQKAALEELARRKAEPAPKPKAAPKPAAKKAVPKPPKPAKKPVVKKAPAKKKSAAKKPAKKTTKKKK